MTDIEKQEIIAEVEASVMEKVDKKYGREDTQSVLKAPREKWFGNSDTRYKACPPMREAFGTFIDYQVWEIIRRLTCLIMGRKYVRQLSGDAKAEEVAERICQFVYDLRNEIRKNEQERSNAYSR